MIDPCRVSQRHVPIESAVDRVGAVARALTSTTGGVAELQREVVCTAASIAGGRWRRPRSRCVRATISTVSVVDPRSPGVRRLRRVGGGRRR